MISSSVGTSTCASPSQQNYSSFVRFCKFFSSRLVQVLVQARCGESTSQRCTASFDQADWFNLRIDELGEVSALLRQTITTYPPLANDLSIDFLLYTADGEFLPLECWHLSVRDEGEDEERWPNMRTQLYHQLGVLLKSAMAAARVTPMFRYYVRHQSADTFIIFYRAYEGRPELDLGEGQKWYSIGSLKSPYGTISLELRYRTKMEIERSLKHPEGKENESPMQTGPRNKENLIEGSPNCQRVSIPFATMKEEVSNEDREETISQCDAYSSFSVSPASQRGFSRTGSISSRLSSRFGRSVSSSDESNVFGVSSSPRMSEAFARGFPTLCGEGQPPRTCSLPFFALLTASTSSVIFRSQPKVLYKVPEDEALGQSHTPTETATPVSSATATTQFNDTPSDETLKEEMRADTLASELQDGAEVETIRASTVSTVVASTVGRSSCYHKSNDLEKQPIESCMSSDDEDSQTPFAADISSDDSFVKVPFGSWHEGDGSDLGDFLHLFRFAPQTSIAFSVDPLALVHDQLARFESQQSTFDRFLASLVHAEEGETESHCELYRSIKPKFF